MADWECVAGGSILIPTGNEKHLFIILNDPEDFNGYPRNCCISVNVSSIRNTPYDKTCILAAGCHPFIQHDSYIAYRYARIETAKHYEGLVKANYCFPNAPVDGNLLVNINDGLKVSPFTPRFIKQLV